MRLLASLILVLFAYHADAQLRLPNYYADNMILQREVKVKFWGWSKPHQDVVVHLANKNYKCTAGADSVWHIELPKSKAGGPFAITVTSNKKIIILNQVYFGDVWFCSGQSNMSFRVDQAKNYDAELADADYPLIRHFGVGLQTSALPKNDVSKSAWSIANATTIGKFSAVAWFFAKEVYKINKVPVGIIHSSWGGTPIEAFMSAADLQAFPAAKKKINKLSNHFIDSVEANNKKLVEASGMAMPKGFINIRNGYPTLVYNAMVTPFFQYPVKGVVWYQGEANSDLPLCFDYERMLSTMINSWRTSWRTPELPFLLVQLANYKQKVKVVSPISGWAITQEAQFKVSQSLKNVGIVITNDIGNPEDAHPTNKQDVGKRLAAVAFRSVYGDNNVVANGPTFKSMHIDGNKITLTFRHVESGLIAKSRGMMLNGFALAGADNIFYKASAQIFGDKVIVHSNQVANPVNVRYAFESNPPEVNFYNKNGFPAPPFRTASLKN